MVLDATVHICIIWRCECIAVARVAARLFVPPVIRFYVGFYVGSLFCEPTNYSLLVGPMLAAVKFSVIFPQGCKDLHLFAD